MRTPTLDDVTQVARDAVYVTVGLGVLAFQQAQTQRQEARKQFEQALAGGKEQVDKVFAALPAWAKGAPLRTIDERITALEERVDALLDQFQQNLPGPTKDLFQQARDAAKSARTQLRGLFPQGDATTEGDAAPADAAA